MIAGVGRSPCDSNGNPLQYSSLGSPIDRGGWWAIVHEFARVRQNLATKPPPPRSTVSTQYFGAFFIIFSSTGKGRGMPGIVRKGERIKEQFICISRCCSVAQSLRPHGLQHTRLLCPSPSPRACSTSCPLSQ